MILNWKLMNEELTHRLECLFLKKQENRKKRKEEIKKAID